VNKFEAPAAGRCLAQKFCESVLNFRGGCAVQLDNPNPSKTRAMTQSKRPHSATQQAVSLEDRRDEAVRSEISDVSDKIHELNNALSCIRLYAGFVVEDCEPESCCRRDAEVIARAVEKATAALAELSQLTRPATSGSWPISRANKR